MIMHNLESAPDMTDVLVWDGMERRWDIGHRRVVADQTLWAVGHVDDVNSCILCNELWLAFSRPLMWSPLPPLQS